MSRRDIPFFGDRGKCADCGKTNWASRTDAKTFAKRSHPGDHLRAYRCGDFWHLGHLTTRPPSRRDDHRETADELGEGDE